LSGELPVRVCTKRPPHAHPEPGTNERKKYQRNKNKKSYKLNHERSEERSADEIKQLELDRKSTFFFRTTKIEKTKRKKTSREKKKKNLNRILFFFDSKG